MISMMLLTACNSLKVVDQTANDGALCTELQVPVNELADALLRWQKETPAEVINRGATVVRGFDSGCA